MENEKKYHHTLYLDIPQIRGFVNKYGFDKHIKKLAIEYISIHECVSGDNVVKKLLIKELIQKIPNDKTKLELNNMMIDYIQFYEERQARNNPLYQEFRERFP